MITPMILPLVVGIIGISWMISGSIQFVEFETEPERTVDQTPIMIIEQPNDPDRPGLLTECEKLHLDLLANFGSHIEGFDEGVQIYESNCGEFGPIGFAQPEWLNFENYYYIPKITEQDCNGWEFTNTTDHSICLTYDELYELAKWWKNETT